MFEHGILNEVFQTRVKTVMNNDEDSMGICFVSSVLLFGLPACLQCPFQKRSLGLFKSPIVGNC